MGLKRWTEHHHRRVEPPAPPGPSLTLGMTFIPPTCYQCTSMSVDRLGRPLRDLRISVTDRCNFRCVYCMPKEIFGPDFAYSHREDLLTFEEIARVAALFVQAGAEKIRLTGGEPLVRRNLERLVEM